MANFLPVIDCNAFKWHRLQQDDLLAADLDGDVRQLRHDQHPSVPDVPAQDPEAQPHDGEALHSDHQDVESNRGIAQGLGR